MVNFDLNEELSDSDCDDLFREDIEALTRACLPTTLNTSSPAVGILSEDDDDDDDDFDDLELVRSIQARYGDRVADNIKPLASLPPPVSDDDDDYEFYQAIKARFSQHDADATDANKKNDVSCRDESVSNDVGASFGREFVDEHIDDAERERYATTEKEGAFTSVSSFPVAAQTFIDAIKKNRACQKFIRNKLLHIEAKMEQINELHKRIKTLRDYQVQCKKQVGQKLSQKQDDRIQLISVAKHRANAKGRESNGSAICYGPPENSYVVWYKAALQKYPLSFHRDKWSNEDIQNLEKGIVRQYQEKLLQRQAHVLSSDEETGFNNGIDAMMLSVKNHKITPETIQCFAGEVNWTQLATIYLPHRSGEECETRWLNRENHLKNSDHWTKAEERSLNASILKKAWTDDEDAKLSSAVELYGDSNWQAVASMLEGRTGPQCSNRWKKTLIPARKRVGKWNDDEDKRLKVAATLFRRSWHRIAQFVPGRTQGQCRERWVNCLNPSLRNRCEWTEEEDTKLREAVAQHGYSWSKVATCVPMRTDNHCLRRWKSLCPHEFPQIQAARTIQKLALISNFVDREEERPTLGPKDFVSLPIEDSANEENGTGKKNPKRQSSNKKTAEKKHKKSKVKTEELEGWEDLPLSVLFDKAFSRQR
ncbi:uncharacterized protein LOC141605703 isoform X2 [Silene latifolia]|uniref:uncharacterized protein LOC141605703 isoform X2 n=1 Tax=Silene latifolia TaxID=37657 RepID=UPI003D785F59